MPVHHRFQRALLGACFISSCCLGACDEKAAKATHRTIESTSRRTPKRPPETPPENTPSIVPADTIVARGKRPTEPAVLAFATSRYVIAWRAEPIAGRSSIRLRIGEIGVKRLGPTIRVSPDDGRIHRDLRLETIGAGRFMVVWWAYRAKPNGDTQREALYREFDTAGKPTPTKRLPSPTGALSLPHFVHFPSGKWVAVWSAKGKKAHHLFSAPLGNEETRSVLDPSKLYHNFFHPLSVTLDENRALVVWWASVGKTGALRGRLISDSGRPLAPPFYVTVQLQHRVFNPTLTRLQNGNVLASWDLHTKRRVKSEVMARLFSNRARPLGPAFVVNTYRKGNQVRPTVAALPHGAFAIAWQSDGQDGDGAGVYCQRFRANGRHEGGETRVARMIEGDQLAPRIAGFETDHLLVLWTHREPSLRQLSMRVLEPFRFPL